MKQAINKCKIYRKRQERGEGMHDTIFSSAPQMTSQLTIILSDHTSFRPALFTLFFMYLKLLCANFEPCHVMAYKNKFENIEATSGRKKVWSDSDFVR